MNVRDPLNLRNSSPALDYLRSGAATVQQRAVQASRRIVSSAQDISKKFDDPIDADQVRSRTRTPLDEAHGTAMSYALPQSGPTQRHHHAGPNGSAQDSSNGGITEKITSAFAGEKKAALPMYKDKPYQYPSSSRNVPWYKRRRLLAALALVLFVLLWWTGIFSSRSTRTPAGSKKEELAPKPEVPKVVPIVEEKDSSWFSAPKIDWDARAQNVKDAFRISWQGYEQNGWGYDMYHPKTKSKNQMTPEGMGWIIVDSLDTLILMNLTHELTHAREWLSNHTYDQDHDVNTFETTIRMLGGLLSAHYLSSQSEGRFAPASDDLGDDIYVEKAADLADRLLGAYNSPSGIPYASVNLHTRQGIPSHVDGGASSTSEATSLQLEMKYLAKVTGEEHYWKKAEKIMEIIDNLNARDGLVPIFVYADRGVYREQNIRLGSRGDSYYEYLIKQYLQTSEQEPVYLAMWNDALAGIKKHLLTYSTPSNFLVLGEKPDGLMGELSPKVDHLVCFMPGTLALAVTGGATLAEARKKSTWTAQHEEDFLIAEELMKTCWGMYKVTPTGLAAEISYFNIDSPPRMYENYTSSTRPVSPSTFEPANKPDYDGDFVGKDDYVIKRMDSHNLQRPETVESLFYMWRITGDEKYRHWGWEMFKSFIQWSATEDGSGFSSISDVMTTPPPLRDNMESFWLAETLKYFYLLFGSNDILPLTDVVFNTEAHPLPRFPLGKLFKTNWERKPRDAEGNFIIKSEAVAADPPSSPAKPNEQVVLQTQIVTKVTEKVIETLPAAAKPLTAAVLTEPQIESIVAPPDPALPQVTDNTAAKASP